MPRQPKIKRYQHYFRIGGFGGGQTVNIAVPWSPAKHTIRMTRTAADVLAGKQGIAVACANALCATTHSNLFPHPVYMAEFTHRHAFIVDRVDRKGQPSHCIKYRHDDQTWIQEFDAPGGKKKLLKSGQAERVVTLDPPAPRVSQAGKNAPRGRAEQKGARSSGKRLSSGSMRRAIDAGWVLNQNAA